MFHIDAILCLGTQFNLTDVQSPKNNSNNSKSKSKSKSNKSEVRFATSELSNTFEARTASILGTKFLAGLTRIEINLSKVVLESSVETTLNTDANNAEDNKWKLQGLISHAPASPNPATATVRDLQFFSINGRHVGFDSGGTDVIVDESERGKVCGE